MESLTITVAAAMIFGDTRHTANQPFNVLSGSGSNGLFPRTEEQTANMAKYGDRLQDYCAGDDPICAGGDVVDDHLNYFDVYSNDVAVWVRERVEAAGGGEPDETTTSKAPTSTTTTERSTTTTTATETEESSAETTTEGTSTSEEEETSTSSTTTSDETTTSDVSDETTSSGAAEETTESEDATTSSAAESAAETTAAEDGGDGEGTAGVLQVNAGLTLAIALGGMVYMRI